MFEPNISTSHRLYWLQDPSKAIVTDWLLMWCRFKWNLNQQVLNLNQSNIIQQSGGTISLSPATSTDVGFYQCFAVNQWGTAVSNVAYVQVSVCRWWVHGAALQLNAPTVKAQHWLMLTTLGYNKAFEILTGQWSLQDDVEYLYVS